MPTAFSSDFRRALAVLLACLVPLQAVAAGVVTVSGPLHTHAPAAATGLILHDFRRAAPPPRAEAPVGNALLHRHGHAHGSAERHRHAAGDAGVVVDSGDRLATADPDDLGFSPSLGVFVGMISLPPTWLDAAATVRAAVPPRWQPRTHHPGLPERPPRAHA